MEEPSSVRESSLPQFALARLVVDFIRRQFDLCESDFSFFVCRDIHSSKIAILLVRFETARTLLNKGIAMSSGMPSNPYSIETSQQGTPSKIPNYLVQSILVTLCCCIPFGIVAIVYAAQVNSKMAANDFAGAQNSSDQAKKWCWIGFGVGLVMNIIVMVAQIMIGVAAQQQGM
jgi:hypothetical protein